MEPTRLSRRLGAPLSQPLRAFLAASARLSRSLNEPLSSPLRASLRRLRAPLSFYSARASLCR